MLTAFNGIDVTAETRKCTTRGIPYHSSKLNPGPCNIVDMWPRTDGQTDRYTDSRDHNIFRVV